jgi:hypothetical protein
MASPTSVTTQNPQPRRKGGASSKGTPAVTDVIDAAYSDERPSRGPWPSEASPTGVLTEVLGEMAFYYGACWLYHRSTPPRRGKTR